MVACSQSGDPKEYSWSMPKMTNVNPVFDFAWVNSRLIPLKIEVCQNHERLAQFG
jgi:hypothetical protein